MAEENKVGRIFVGGLSWDTTESTLTRTFSQYGKVIDSQGSFELHFSNFNQAITDSQRLRSLPFPYVRMLAKLQEKRNSLIN